MKKNGSKKFVGTKKKKIEKIKMDRLEKEGLYEKLNC